MAKKRSFQMGSASCSAKTEVTLSKYLTIIYASDNSYESGKVDPFAEDSEPVDEKVTMHKVNGITTNSQNANVKNTVKNEVKNTASKGNIYNPQNNSVGDSATIIDYNYIF